MIKSISSHINRVPTTPFRDPNDMDAYPVRNQRGASVGIVVGDGFILRDSGANLPWIDLLSDVQDLTMTFFIDGRYILEALRTETKVFDIGVELQGSEKTSRDKIELRPLNVSMWLENGKIIDMPFEGNSYKLSATLSRPFQWSDRRLYPILRNKGWVTQNTEDPFTSGEKAMLISFAVLYAACLVVVLVMLYLTVTLSQHPSNILMLSFAATILFLRALYISLAASGELLDSAPESYVLVEPPSFLLVSLSMVVIMCFAFCLRSIKGTLSVMDQSRKKYWVVWFLSQIPLYAVMIIVIALLCTINTSDVTTSSCFGRIENIEKNRNVQNVRIAYHSFMLAVALAAATCVIALTMKIYDRMRAEAVIYLCLVVGASLLLSNILWVAYSAADGSTPYFVIPLFFTEGVPLFCLAILLRPRNIRQLRLARKVETSNSSKATTRGARLSTVTHSRATAESGTA